MLKRKVIAGRKRQWRSRSSHFRCLTDGTRFATCAPLMRSVPILALVLALHGCSIDRQSKSQRDFDEMNQIYEADQNDRVVDITRMSEQEGKKWAQAVGPRDAGRRERVRKFLERGALRSGRDFEQAAFIFQHGFSSDDFLLAHILATAAVAKGDTKARWIAAATLDRYLQSLQQRQVFGSQFNNPDRQPGHWTLEPLDQTLIPDSVRHIFCSPDIATQERAVVRMNAGLEMERPSDFAQFDSGCS
jgi:hypothetical protein